MVKWNTSRSSPNAVKVQTVKAGRTHIFIALKPAAKWPSTLVHYDRETRRSVPCEQDASCPYCPRPPIWKAYPPVMMYLGDTRAVHQNPAQLPLCVKAFNPDNWVGRVLEVTEGIITSLEDVRHGDFFYVSRKGDYRNAPLSAGVYESPRMVPLSYDFDECKIMERAFRRD